jgi:hypothetical protein
MIGKPDTEMADPRHLLGAVQPGDGLVAFGEAGGQSGRAILGRLRAAIEAYVGRGA